MASDEKIINYLKHNSRTLIFSASITPASTGCVLAALDVMEEETWRKDALWANTHRAKAGFLQAGFEIGPTETLLSHCMCAITQKHSSLPVCWWTTVFCKSGSFAGSTIGRFADSLFVDGYTYFWSNRWVYRKNFEGCTYAGNYSIIPKIRINNWNRTDLENRLVLFFVCILIPYRIDVWMLWNIGCLYALAFWRQQKH